MVAAQKRAAERLGGVGGTPSFRDGAKRALRAAGMRWTQQRDTLLEVIEDAEGHQDADGLYRLARDRDPPISLSTVYRTLAILKRHGLVDELHLSEEHHHYEAKTAERHFHFVCTSCGAVTEFTGAAVDRLSEELRREHGFDVQAIDLDVSGRCARCAG